MDQYISPTDFKHLYKIVRRKNVVTKNIFLNNEGNILLVKPVGKEYWSLPGGITEQNESPKDGATREVRDELGIDFMPKQLLLVNYSNQKDIDSITLYFYGGILNAEQIEKIKLVDGELESFAFFKQNEIENILNGKANIINNCLEAISGLKVSYFENNSKLF